MTKTYNITGMKCQGCVNTVTEKLSAVKGVENVKVDLENKQVTIEGKPWKWSSVPSKALSSNLVTKFKTRKNSYQAVFFYP